MWVPKLRRWLLPVELAYMHGYPVTAEAARDLGVQFDPFGALYSCSQLGNCMHLANDGSVLAIVLACVSRV